MPDLTHAHFATRAVHAGERIPAAELGTPVSSPITPSVGYTHPEMKTTDAILGSEQPGYVYARYTTPSVHAFELAVAALEGAPAAQAYASGMAALHGALLGAGLQAGSRVVAALDLYGATYSLLNTLLGSLGVETVFVNASDLEALAAGVRQSSPRAVLVETISNPLLKVADIPRIAEIAHAGGAKLIVDNTFASPYLFQPLAHGADYAVHSATKYLSGHGDVLAGIVVCARADDCAKLYEINKITGAALGPFEAWLALRGLKTLPLRMQRQCDNALHVAAALQAHPLIHGVRYPGLAAHPHHALAQALFGGRGAGGVIAFEIAGAGKADVFRFMDALSLIQPATTLGDIYSLVLHPATSSHRALSPAERLQAGIPDNLVRLSCGIEGVEDILQDVFAALDQVRRPTNKSRS
jgi:cystathionine gamma-synthase/methionine-gamma-lyase